MPANVNSAGTDQSFQKREATYPRPPAADDHDDQRVTPEGSLLTTPGEPPRESQDESEHHDGLAVERLELGHERGTDPRNADREVSVEQHLAHVGNWLSREEGPQDDPRGQGEPEPPGGSPAARYRQGHHGYGQEVEAAVNPCGECSAHDEDERGGAPPVRLQPREKEKDEGYDRRGDEQRPPTHQPNDLHRIEEVQEHQRAQPRLWSFQDQNRSQGEHDEDREPPRSEPDPQPGTRRRGAATRESRASPDCCRA